MKSAKGLWQKLAFGIGGVALGVTLTLVGSSYAGDPQPPQDAQVLVALGQLMDTEHRRVDLLLEKGDVKGAIAALEALRKEAWPSRKVGGDASIQLRHDAYGRLVRLRLDHPKVDPVPPQELLKTVNEGLGREAELIEDNVFTARLVAQQGEIYELLQRDDDALTAYERALDINRGLLDDLLGRAGK